MCEWNKSSMFLNSKPACHVTPLCCKYTANKSPKKTKQVDTGTHKRIMAPGDFYGDAQRQLII